MYEKQEIELVGPEGCHFQELQVIRFGGTRFRHPEKNETIHLTAVVVGLADSSFPKRNWGKGAKYLRRMYGKTNNDQRATS